MQVGADKPIWDLSLVREELELALRVLSRARGRERKRLLRRIRLLLLWMDEILAEEDAPVELFSDPLAPAVVRFLLADVEGGSLLDGSHPGLQTILILRQGFGRTPQPS